MKNLEMLVQGEKIPDIQFIALEGEASVVAVLEIAAGLRQGEPLVGELFVFVEGADHPVGPDHCFKPHNDGPHRIHVHRCREVAVTVNFNGKSEPGTFAPAKTVASVKKWAVQQFHMDPRDAAEHVLQIAGTTDRPEPDTHIGSLVHNGKCSITFDLVPLKRVEG